VRRDDTLVSVNEARTAIVFGKGPVAIHAATNLRKAGFDIIGVVPSTEEFDGQPRLAEWGQEQGVPVRRAADLDVICDDGADLGLSVYFDRIFRPRHIAGFARLLNVHNSLLPRNRGVRPINWALKENETRHGVTLHEIEPGVDTGAIVAQAAFAIDPDVDEVADVYARCTAAAMDLITAAAPQMLTLAATPQDETAATTHRSADDDLLGDRRFWRRGDRGLI